MAVTVGYIFVVTVCVALLVSIYTSAGIAVVDVTVVRCCCVVCLVECCCCCCYMLE